MYFKIKTTKTIIAQNGKQKSVNEVFLTDALHFADAGYKVIQEIGTEAEVTDVSLMKNLKPAINEQRDEEDKLFIIKIAEEQIQEDGDYKTVKYSLPAFAKDSLELQSIAQDYLKQGLENMRLTTISETKWIYI